MGSPDRNVGFVASRNPEQVNLRETYDRLAPLFGSLAKADKDGFILIPQWLSIPRGEATTDQFMVLQKHSWGDEAVLKTGWKSKDNVASLTIKKVTKDDGHIQAAIRLCDHVLAGVQGKEKEQVVTVIERTDFLLDQFSQVSLQEVGEEQLEAWQEGTIQELLSVGLDPNTVELEVKMLMSFWLIKGSGGKDLTGRVNDLISGSALKAAQTRAQKRQLTLDSQMSDKYLQMRLALKLAEAVSRNPLEIVTEELRERFLSNRYLKNPDLSAGKDLAYTRGKAGSMSWLLTQTWVRPYRPVAMEVKGNLDIVYDLLTKEKKGEIFTRNLPQILAKDVEKMMAVLS